MFRHHLPRRSLLTATGLTTLTAVLGAPGIAQASSGATTAGAAKIDGPAPASPEAALARLLTGNRRFASGRARHPHQSPRDLRELASGQDPFAIVLGCADSRVSPELLFDQGLGDLFDNRVAGNIVTDLLLGSIEYAVEHFNPPLLMVLGHERCGAVSATIETIENGGTAPGHIGAIVDALRPIIEPVLHEPGDKVENSVQANIRAQVATLEERSDIVQERVEAGALAVIAARYDLDTGRVFIIH